LQSVENSLKRLKTDYIDLLQVHWWDIATPLSETFKTLDDLVRVGKVRYIGISNFCGYQLQQTIDLIKEMKWDSVVSLQPQYNLLCRSTEWDLIPICQRENMAVLPWSPLAGGWLAGKYSRNATGPIEGSRIAWAEGIGWKPTGWKSKSEDDITWNTLDSIAKIAKETGKTSAQVSLRWLIQKPGTIIPIIGAKSVAQLKDNLGCLGWQLSEKQMEELDNASARPIPYPWGEAWNKVRNPLDILKLQNK